MQYVLVICLQELAKEGYDWEMKIKTDPLRAVNTLMRKGMCQTAVSTIKVSSVTLNRFGNMEPKRITEMLQLSTR